MKKILVLISMLIITANFIEGQSMLNPKFPIIENNYQLTKEWSIQLDQKYNRRIENNDMCIWRPGFTMWIAVWNNDKNETKEQRFMWIKEESSKDLKYPRELRNEDSIYYSYRLNEGEKVDAFYGYVIGKSGHIQIAIYFDNEKDSALAKNILKSIKEKS